MTHLRSWSCTAWLMVLQAVSVQQTILNFALLSPDKQSTMQASFTKHQLCVLLHHLACGKQVNCKQLTNFTLNCSKCEHEQLNSRSGRVMSLQCQGVLHVLQVLVVILLVRVAF